MNDEEKRVAIAEAVGETGISDYLHDLNEMWMAVESLGIDGEEWAHILWTDLCNGKPYSDRKAMLLMTHATAAQQANAFIKFLERAKGTKP